MKFFMKNQMNDYVSEVNIEIVKPQNGLVGFANIVIESNIYLSGIAIYKKLNAEGYRLLYPKKNGFSLFHPINKETSVAIEEAIFSKLKSVINKSCEGYDRYNSDNNSSL